MSGRAVESLLRFEGTHSAWSALLLQPLWQAVLVHQPFYILHAPLSDCSIAVKADTFYYIVVSGSKAVDAGAFQLTVKNTALPA